jgi:hypothetical protein
MKTPLKITAFVAGLAAVFGAALGVGSLVGPVASAADQPHAMPEMTEGDTAASELPGGLMISDQGYTLDLAAAALPAGPATELRFSIRGADGQAVTAYQTSHDKDLHLIAVRRDLSGFQHVHPVLAADGTWSVPLALTAGQWRVFADFVPADGEGLPLGADLAVAGTYTPQPLPGQIATAQVDGYTVTLAGDLRPGAESRLTLSVSRDGRPVTDLQPYLGAYGHLVALRAGDLAYLHVHPAGEPGDGATTPGPDITFHTTTPSAGAYRLFLDFQHQGKVHTAAFTVHANAQAPTPSSAPPAVSPSTAPSSGSQEHGDGGHG